MCRVCRSNIYQMNIDKSMQHTIEILGQFTPNIGAVKDCFQHLLLHYQWHTDIILFNNKIKILLFVYFVMNQIVLFIIVIRKWQCMRKAYL